MNLERARVLHEKTDRRIAELYEKRTAWSQQSRVREEKLGCAFATVRADSGAQSALKRLLFLLQHHGQLTGIRPVIEVWGARTGNTGLDALLHLAQCHAHWLHAPEEWQLPMGGAPAEQFASLAHHLLVRYPVPAFLDAAWFEGFSEAGARHRRWFLTLAQGGSLHRLDFPLPMTHRAANLFVQAPGTCSLVGALRRAQILALGGSERLARTVTDTRLRDYLPDEEFWYSTLQFLVNHEREIAPAQIGPIVDFLQYRRFGTDEEIAAAPEPTFSMKGRTVGALQRRVDEWHEELQKEDRRTPTQWCSCGIEPWSLTEQEAASGTTLNWTMVEITNSVALTEEGRDMRHCVTSYRSNCVKETISLFSLRVNASDTRVTRRIATVEVQRARRAVVQVRGKCNQLLSAGRAHGRMRRAISILRHWAREHRLSVVTKI